MSSYDPLLTVILWVGMLFGLVTGLSLLPDIFTRYFESLEDAAESGA